MKSFWILTIIQSKIGTKEKSVNIVLAALQKVFDGFFYNRLGILHRTETSNRLTIFVDDKLDKKSRYISLVGMVLKYTNIMKKVEVVKNYPGEDNCEVSNQAPKIMN